MHLVGLLLLLKQDVEALVSILAFDSGKFAICHFAIGGH